MPLQGFLGAFAVTIVSAPAFSNARTNSAPARHAQAHESLRSDRHGDKHFPQRLQRPAECQS
jgi:hypothetical protein